MPGARRTEQRPEQDPAGSGEEASGGSLEARRANEILEKRAARLAVPKAAAETRDAAAVLVFQVAAEHYAVELPQLLEIIPGPAITMVPGGPLALAGVINFRGQIMPVWDAARLLRGDGQDHCSTGPVLLLRHATLRGGLRVDGGLQTRLAPRATWRAAGLSPPYSRGTAADMVTLVDLAALLKQGGLE
jgi:chemotaxis signal transduction protein